MYGFSGESMDGRLEFRKSFFQKAAVLFCTLILISLSFSFRAEAAVVTNNAGVAEDSPAVVEAQKAFTVLPPNVIAHVEALGWKFSIARQRDIEILFPDIEGKAVAYSDHTYKKIVVSEEAKDVMGSIIHEIGHIVDYGSAYGRLSPTPEFTAIFAEEGRRYTAYGATGAREFFAEIFRGLCTDPLYIHSICPKAAAYVTAATLVF